MTEIKDLFKFTQRKKEQTKGLSFIFLLFDQSNSANYLAGTKAAWAYGDCLGRTVNNRSYCSYISFPSSVASSVRMAHSDTEWYALSTNFTLCHQKHLHFVTVFIILTQFIHFCKCFFNFFQNLAYFYKFKAYIHANIQKLA